MILIASKEEKELIKRLREIGVNEESAGELSAEIITLKRQISDLEIQKSKKTEEFETRERELRHMIGLEKKRQEFEIEQSKRETTVKVREENLAADKKRFEEQMTFQGKRFEEEVGYLKKMISDVLTRLPNVNMDIKKR